MAEPATEGVEARWLAAFVDSLARGVAALRFVRPDRLVRPDHLDILLSG